MILFIELQVAEDAAASEKQHVTFSAADAVIGADGVGNESPDAATQDKTAVIGKTSGLHFHSYISLHFCSSLIFPYNNVKLSCEVITAVSLFFWMIDSKKCCQNEHINNEHIKN